MKLKGISWIEQHVEKIVVGVVGAGLLAALASQFLLSPNRVEVAPGQTRPPDRVYEYLGAEADQLRGRILEENPVLPEVETPALSARYEAAAARVEFAEPPERRVALGPAVEVEIDTEGIRTSGPVQPLRVPAPVSVASSSQWSTIDPYFAARHSGLRSKLPAEQPLDTASVSVEAAFDGTALAEELRQAGEGYRPIPLGWWSGAMGVLRVEVERQGRSRPDAAWGETEPVEEVTWAPSLLERFGGESGGVTSWGSLTPAELQSVTRLSASSLWLASQRPFPPTIAGPVWLPPSEALERTERLAMVDDAQVLVRKIGTLEDEVAELEEELRGGGRTARRPERDSRPDRGDARRRSETSARSRERDADAERMRQERIESRVQSRIDAKQAELDALRAELAEMGFEGDADMTEAGLGLALDDEERDRSRRRDGPGFDRPLDRPDFGDRGFDRGPPGARGRDEFAVSRRSFGSARSETGLLEEEAWKVWTHDFDVDPGHEYRYRVRIAVNNPLYKRQRSLGSEDADYLAVADEPMVFSSWTGWTEPVVVGRPSYFFVTTATDRGELGKAAATATAEVFRMFYGHYRRQTITLEPGDPVAATFELPENLLVFDVAASDPEEVRAYFDEVARAEEEAARDADRGGLRGERRGPGFDPGDRDDFRASSPSEPSEAFEAPLPAGASRLPTELDLSTESMMLDVAPIPGRSAGSRGATHEVILFDPAVGLTIRRPDADVDSEAYRRVSVSARFGGESGLRAPMVDER